MKAIVLAAGRGSRMKGLTEEQPKCLLKLNGQPLIDIQVEALERAGATDIAIVTGYRRELLTGRGLTEFHNLRWDVTNMLSSLACAEEWLEENPCLVSYSDIFYTVDAPRSLFEVDQDIAITYDPNWRELWERRFEDPLEDAETFRIDKDGMLLEIGKKPQIVQEIEGQYMGLLKFTPSGWAAAQRVRDSLDPSTRDSIHLTGLLQRIIQNKTPRVAAIAYHGVWGEIDTPRDLTLYQG